jgi:hypothetical protein
MSPRRCRLSLKDPTETNSLGAYVHPEQIHLHLSGSCIERRRFRVLLRRLQSPKRLQGSKYAPAEMGTANSREQSVRSKAIVEVGGARGPVGAQSASGFGHNCQ